jgi:hypothetical protein
MTYSHCIKPLLAITGFFAILIGPAYSQSVTLTTGSGSGAPGATVNIGISVASSGGAQPAGLQWTLSYSSADISNITVTADSAATSAGKSVSCSSSSGSTICVIFGLNTTTIANGSVAVASFQIAPASQAASIPIQISGVVAATSGGGSITASGAGGTITVNQPVSGYWVRFIFLSPEGVLRHHPSCGRSSGLNYLRKGRILL